MARCRAVRRRPTGTKLSRIPGGHLMALCSLAGLARFCSVASLLVTLVASAMNAQAAANCDGGTADNCLVLGDKYRDGVDVAKDPARAAALYQTACDGGVLAACNRLGALYERQDTSRAVALFQKACEGGGLPGCTNLGLVYMGGEGVATDTARAAALFREACDGADLDGCNSLGIV